ncbi:L,D-transpeptidase family protein [Flaviflagellibacter deserti]|uniref:L,D-transpeptidase family protein n=1 Tax=Flaviflagellibacter deserti TaxID=2267266 RepID=A0ABV9YX93_9HYPH
MTRRLTLAVLFGAAAITLAGCQTETASSGPKEQRAISPKTVALMEKKGMRKEDPILVRIYKEDSQLEVWKKKRDTGRYALLKTYEICRFSGDLGPKKTEGDRQSPEGFYTIAPGQMNPKSSYYLSFDLGFPNAYDRSLGRSGAHLMVHGDCLSKGCYAMTDEQIADVYALAREAFKGGQRGFQVQALPFRMTAENLARRRDNANLAFWKNLKEGTDHFEVSGLEPKVDVCGKKYVFDATAEGGSFDPNAACPTYQVDPAIAQAAAKKAEADDKKFAELVNEGVQVAEAYIPQNGRVRRTLEEPVLSPAMIAAAKQTAPMTPIPNNGGPASTSQPTTALAMAEGAVPTPVPSPYASAQPKPQQQQQSSGGMFAWLGTSKSDKPAELDTPQTPAARAGATPSETTGAVTLASATSRPAAAPASVRAAPITASLAPTTSEKPFYKRWLSFGGGAEEKAQTPAPAAAAAVPTPAPKPTTAPAVHPAPKPVAAAPAAPESKPAPQTASAAPSHPNGLPPVSVDPYGFSTPILNSGGFSR